MYLSGFVMKARKEYDVQYPNLYGEIFVRAISRCFLNTPPPSLFLSSSIVAVPKYHKNADEFNRVQRGHQNYLEGDTTYSIMTLLGGLKFPLMCAGGSVFFCLGSILYMKGYADNSLDVKMARYKKGAGIKWIGFLISFVSTMRLGISLIRG